MKSIFVSSTFKDMQAERDMLHTIVMPEINEFARLYRQTVSFSDLRWGVNTLDMDSNEGARKVLSVCLDEIERCKPYMIIFIGERYGWIPESKNLEDIAREKNYSLDELEKSVTALEIEYGALSETNHLDNCLFYFRNPIMLDEIPDEFSHVFRSESELHKLKLDDLKKRIEKVAGHKIVYYDANWDAEKKKLVGLDFLATKICEDLKALFINEFGILKNMPWQEIELNNTYTQLDNCTNRFVGKDDLVKDYTNKILNENFNLLMIDGDSGGGKTTIASALIKTAKTQGYEAITVICGGQRSTDLSDVLSQICYQLEELYCVPHNYVENNKDRVVQYSDRFEELLDIGIDKNKSVLITIDGLDKLKKHDMLESLSWLPRAYYKGLKLVFTYDSKAIALSDNIPKSIKALKVSLPKLTLDEEIELVDGIVKSYGKELPSMVIKAICELNDMDTPLYYSLIVHRLLMIDSEDFYEIKRRGDDINAINSYMMDFVNVCPNSIQKVACFVLLEAARRININLCNCILPMLCSVRYGLRESDLEVLCSLLGVEFNHLDLVRFLKYMSPYFVVNNEGYIYIPNELIRQGLYHELHKDRQFLIILYDYAKRAPEDDMLFYYEALRLSKELDDKKFLLSYADVYFNENILDDFVLFSEIRRSLYEVLGVGHFLKDCIEYYALSENLNNDSIDNFLALVNMLGITSFYNLQEDNKKYSLICSVFELAKKRYEAGGLNKVENYYGIILKLKADIEYAREDFKNSANLYIQFIEFYESYLSFSQRSDVKERIYPSIIESCVLVANSMRRTNNNKDAIRFYETALDYIDKSFGLLEESKLLYNKVEAMKSIALIKNEGKSIGEKVESLELIEQAKNILLDMMDKYNTERLDRELGVTYSILSSFYTERGRLDDAKMCTNSAMFFAYNDEEEKGMSDACLKIVEGRNYNESKHFENAVDCFCEAIEILIDLNNQEPSYDSIGALANAYRDLMKSYMGLFEYDDAKASFEKSKNFYNMLSDYNKINNEGKDMIYDINLEWYEYRVEDDSEEGYSLLEECLSIAQEQYDIVKDTDASEKNIRINYYRLGKIYDYMAYHQYINENYKIAIEIYHKCNDIYAALADKTNDPMIIEKFIYSSSRKTEACRKLGMNDIAAGYTDRYIEFLMELMNNDGKTLQRYELLMFLYKTFIYGLDDYNNSEKAAEECINVINIYEGLDDEYVSVKMQDIAAPLYWYITVYCYNLNSISQAYEYALKCKKIYTYLNEIYSGFYDEEVNDIENLISKMN